MELKSGLAECPHPVQSRVMSQSFLNAIGAAPRTTSLSMTLERAFIYAQQQSHRLVTLEHLLLALTEDVDGAALLQAGGVDLERLRDEVAGFVGGLPDRFPRGEEREPAPAEELLRIMDYAAAAAQSSGRRAIDGAVVLAAMVGEARSPSAELLRAHGLTFEAAIRTLQSRGANPPTVRVQPPKPEPARPEGVGAAAAAPAVAPSVADVMRSVRDAISEPMQRPAYRTERAPPPVARPAAPYPPPHLNGADRVRPERLDPERPERGGTYRPEPEPRYELEPEAEPYSPAEPYGTEYAETYNEERSPAPPPRQQPPLGRPQAVRPPPQRAAAPAAAAKPATGKPRAKLPGKPVPTGTLVENIPRSMRVGIGEQVEVRISQRQMAQLNEGLQGRGRAVEHTVFVAKAMSVRLRAPEGGFFIETASPETQWLDAAQHLLNEEYASWRWTVTPQARGKRALQVIVSARTTDQNGLSADTPLPEQVIEVKVRTNYAILARQAGYWAIAALFGGVLGAFGDSAWRLLAGLMR